MFRYLFKSLSFGIAAKFVGLFVVILALPAISRNVDKEVYSIFLTVMAITSLATLPFGVLNIPAVREIHQLISDIERGRLQSDAEQLVVNSLSLYIILALPMFILVSSYSLFLEGSNAAVLLLTNMYVIFGVLSWSDAVHLARKEDYLTSVVHATSYFFVIIFVLSDPLNSDYSLVYVFFALPAIAQAILFIRILVLYKAHRLRLYRFVGGSFEAISQSLAFSLINYAVVFGSGIVAGIFVGENVKIIVATIVLVVARLVNPVSLINRPILPVYLDAVYYKKVESIKLIRKFYVVFFVVIFSGAIVLSILLPTYIIRYFVPDYIRIDEKIIVYSVCLLLASMLSVALSTPIILARNRGRLLVMVYGLSSALAIVLGAIGANKLEGDHIMLSIMATIMMIGSVFISVYTIHQIGMDIKSMQKL